MQNQKSNIEKILTPSQTQIIINSWRMVDFTGFFMIMTCLDPFITDYNVKDELNFLISVMYQKTHTEAPHFKLKILDT